MDNFTITTPATFRLTVGTCDGVPSSFFAMAQFATAEQAALAAAELPKKMKAKVRTICDEYFVEVTAQLRSVKGNAVNETGCDRFFALVNSYRCEFDSHGALAYASMDEAKAAICLQRWGK